MRIRLKVELIVKIDTDQELKLTDLKNLVRTNLASGKYMLNNISFKSEYEGVE